MKIGLEGSSIENAVEKSSFEFEKFNEESGLVPETVLKIFKGADSNSTEELCKSCATGFWTVAVHLRCCNFC